MIHNTEFFEMIEDYCLGLLSEELKNDFEAELKQNPELSKEVELQMEIHDAIVENDVLTLRNKLEKVAKQNTSQSVSDNPFELTDEISEIQEINEVLTTEELINFYDSLPKVHAYHHESTSNENIHQFYREQQNEADVNGFDELDDLDFDMEFEGLEEAILEKDVLNLRQTLKQVAKSVEPQFTVEEIDDFLNGDLSGEDLFEFEKELTKNRSLREEVQLHSEMEMAVQEFDIMDLRNQISSIVESETSWNVSEKSIEDFIDGLLEGEEMDEFSKELQDNLDLRAEVKLRQQVNELLGESDIEGLRAQLNVAKDQTDVKKVKMFIPETKVSHLNFWKTSVAIMIVLLGIATVLNNGRLTTSMDDIYSSTYVSPTLPTERSLMDSNDGYLQVAKNEYINQNWTKSHEMFSNAPDELKTIPAVQFYDAASLQNLKKYNEAAQIYSKVIENGNNVFVQEAEMNKALCYIAAAKYKEAKSQLEAVIERKNSYEKDARAILRRLKYSFK